MRSTWGRRAAAALAAAVVLAGCGSDEEATDDAAPAAAVEESSDETGEETASDAPADDGSADATDGDGDADESTADDASAEDGSGDEAGGDGAEVLAATLDATAQVTTARTRVTSTSATPDGEVTVTAEGVQSGGDAQLTMQLSGPQVTGPGGAQMDDIDVILLDGVMYQRFPMLTEALGSDAQWLRLDLESLGPEFADVYEAAESSDPAQQLDVLEQAGDVTVVGQEEIGGVATTHLQVVVTMRAALAAQGLDPSTFDDSGIDPDEPVLYDLWVDEDDRMRRMESEVDVDGMSSRTTMEVLEYDIDVSITAPPAEDTIDFDVLMGGLGASGG